MNLRERKKVKTRQALGDAAVLLFLERGYDETTVEEIAAASGVSRRTFFRYFSSKEAAFFAAHDARYEVFVSAAVEARTTLGAWRAVCDGALQLASATAADRRGLVAWHAVLAGVPALHALGMAQDLRWEARVRETFLCDELTPFEAAIRAGAVMGVLRAVLADWIADGARGDLVVAVRRALDWLSRALPTTPAAPSLAAARYENSERTLSQSP